MKVKSKGVWGFKPKLGILAVIYLCTCFFLAGLLFSKIIHQDGRGYQSVEGFDQAVISGETGESAVDSIPFQVLSWKPRAVYFPNFATAEQCKSIIDMAKPKVSPSTLALRKGETAETTKGVRTSSGTFIRSAHDKTGTLDFIERKIAKATMIPRNHGEAFNILRYDIGQRYVSHFDAFDPAEYGPQKSQRLASFLVYLSDVEEGGETVFPYENGSIPPDFNYEQCVGLKLKPRQGDGLLFYSLFTNGTIDKRSLHGSCPVIRGQKWVATKWIRDQEQEDYIYPS